MLSHGYDDWLIYLVLDKLSFYPSDSRHRSECRHFPRVACVISGASFLSLFVHQHGTGCTSFLRTGVASSLPFSSFLSV